VSLKSVASILLYVTNPKASSKFYQELGFQESKTSDSICEVRLNWFKIQLVASSTAKDLEFKKEANAKIKGAGLYTYISVENIDDYYKELRNKGIKTSSEPRDWPWGNREFVVRDLDGYKLVFYQIVNK
jgi:catechol 2,3-dioxygenase-like lactoylglutathione lyase family enzyme